MAKIYDDVEDLHPLCKDWAIKVRIVHLWKTPAILSSSDDYSLEMILCDHKVNIKLFLITMAGNNGNHKRFRYIYLNFVYFISGCLYSCCC